MKLSEGLQTKLAKKYTPSSLINLEYNGKDVAVKTDAEGNPVLAFVGKRTEAGSIRGDRYTRVLKYNKEGKVIKDHWDLKGKAS
jgi:hypothetical protein